MVLGIKLRVIVVSLQSRSQDQYNFPLKDMVECYENDTKQLWSVYKW